MPPNAGMSVLAAVLGAISACAPASQQAQQTRSYLVFFTEFSANLSPDTTAVIDQAASAAKRQQVRTVRVEARANATGSADATMKIAETRAAVVRDALLADGVPPNTIRVLAIGQDGTTDTGVAPRRVDIVFEN